MRTFMVPCFVVVVAEDENGAVEKMQSMQGKTEYFLYQDGGLPTKEVPPDEEYHSIRDFYSYEELITGELDKPDR